MTDPQNPPQTPRKYKDFEDFLQEKHAEQYAGLDDEMPDDFNRWLCEEISPDEWIEYGNQYAASRPAPEAKRSCPKHPEGGLRHEFIYCHCDMDKADALEKAEDAVIEAARKFWRKRFAELGAECEHGFLIPGCTNGDCEENNLEQAFAALDKLGGGK